MGYEREAERRYDCGVLDTWMGLGRRDLYIRQMEYQQKSSAESNPRLELQTKRINPLEACFSFFNTRDAAP